MEREDAEAPMPAPPAETADPSTGLTGTFTTAGYDRLLGYVLNGKYPAQPSLCRGGRGADPGLAHTTPFVKSHHSRSRADQFRPTSTRNW